METAQEKVFYQDKNVTVTQSRFIANGKTFAMRNISSVTNYRIEAGKGFAYFMIFIGFLFLFADSFRVFGGIMIVIGILVIVIQKDTYAVRISSNSGEANALESPDEPYIQKIVDAVNQAMVHRG